MQAHIMSLHTHSAHGVGQKVVMLHIILKGMEHRAPCMHKHILSKGQKIFLKVIMMHTKLKGMGLIASCKHIYFP